MFNRIVIVCVGNICRSPMAEALLAKRLQAVSPQTRVESAGLAALVGRPAEPDAVALMRERGLDLSGHRARQLTPEMVKAADLVLVMEQPQQRALESLLPACRGRVYRLGHWGDFDIPDPYQKGREAFAESLALIDRGIADFERRMGSGR